MRHHEWDGRTILALVLLLLALGAGGWWLAPRTASRPARGASGATSAPRPGGPAADTSRVSALSAAPQSRPATPPERVAGASQDDAVRQLEEVIRQHGDSYARERAVFDLAQLQQEASVPFLKELAMRDPDVNVRAAAFANIRLLKKELPEPAKGDLRVQTSGPVLVGGRVTIDVTFASQVDVTRARLLLHVPPGIELVGGERGWTGRLTANQPQQVKAEMEIQRDGTLVVPVALKLDWDQVDYELIQKSIVLDTSSGRVVVREQGHDAGGR